MEPPDLKEPPEPTKTPALANPVRTWFRRHGAVLGALLVAAILSGVGAMFLLGSTTILRPSSHGNTNSSPSAPPSSASKTTTALGLPNNRGLDQVNQVKPGNCIDPVYKAAIGRIWDGQRQMLKDFINANLKQQSSIVLYDIQIETNPLLDYARQCQDTMLIDQLCDLYLTALGSGSASYLTDVNGALEWKASPSTNENIITSSQFIYLLARTMNTIGYIPAAHRSQIMQDFVAKYSQIVLVDHLRRWVFAKTSTSADRADYRTFTPAWSNCLTGHDQSGRAIYNHSTFSHSQWIDELRAKRVGTTPQYCNVVRDADLWVIAATAEMIDAKDHLGAAIPDGLMSTSERQAYLEYLRRAADLVRSRTSATSLTNFQDQPVRGLLFDADVWKDHPDYYFAGYSDIHPPAATDPKRPVAGIGWDLSHARRFVQVFNSLYEKRDLVGAGFPTIDDMRGFANQFAYGVFNKDLTQPLFNNYFDGTAGWYRVNYQNRADFGYAPYGSSSSGFSGGFGLWSAYNPDIKTIMTAGVNMLAAPSTFRDKYYNHDPGQKTAAQDPDFFYRYNRFNLNPNTSLDYLELYPSLVNFGD